MSNQMLQSLVPVVPIGMELESVYNQPLEVERSVGGFIVSVGQAVAIVLIVLLAFMGLRTGIVIGAVLLITVAGTLFLMNIFGIELQRISLGALVIALGMLVDNAIVVAEGMQVRMEAGMKAVQAAGKPLAKPSGRCWGHCYRYPRLLRDWPVAGQHRRIRQLPFYVILISCR